MIFFLLLCDTDPKEKISSFPGLKTTLIFKKMRKLSYRQALHKKEIVNLDLKQKKNILT